MSGEQAVAVGIRVFGIWLLLRSMEIALGLIHFVMHPANQSSSLVFVIPTLIYLVLGGVLAWAPQSVASFLLPSSSAPSKKFSWSLDEFQSILFSVLGAYFLITAITNLTVWANTWLYFVDPDSRGQIKTIPVLAEAGSHALKLVAGIWLLFGGRGIRNIVYKLRNLGAGQ